MRQIIRTICRRCIDPEGQVIKNVNALEMDDLAGIREGAKRGAENLCLSELVAAVGLEPTT
jgi:hypothetical protein